MSATKNAILNVVTNNENFDIDAFEKPQLLRWENGNPVFYLPQYIGTRFETYTVNGSRLLSNGTTNVKTAKNGNEFLTAQHSMRPSNFAGIGNVCSSASNGCKSACLESSGNASIFQMINAARDAKTAPNPANPRKTTQTAIRIPYAFHTHSIQRFWRFLALPRTLPRTPIRGLSQAIFDG